MLISLLVLHGVVGLAVFAGGRTLGRRATLIGATAPAVGLIVALTQLANVRSGGVIRQTLRWVPALGVSGALRLDAFAMVMVFAVTAVGLAVLVYSYAYFSADDATVARFAGLMVLFAGAMLGVVLADDLITLFTAWELTSITSYLLIGNRYTEVQARAAALHALLVTSMGGLVMLAGIVLIGEAAGTYRLSEILARPPSGTPVTAGLVCVAIGAFTKSAQYPFHAWLPGAMAAPTPASAYLHSATMVKAGIYLVGRFAPVFAGTAPWRPLVITVGLVTMVAGGLRALRQYDLKLLLAHGTVSQLGFLMVLFGAGTPATVHAGIVMLAAHILLKAALFMVVGIIDHQTGTRDIRIIPVLGRGWTATKVVAVVSAASMAGVPLLAGFVGKEAAFESLLHHPFRASGGVLAVVVAGSALTVAYSARFLWGAFVLPPRLRTGTEAVLTPVEEAPSISGTPPQPIIVVPAALLTVVTIVGGLVPGVATRLATAATRSLSPDSTPAKLAAFHGFNTALWLSVAAVATGLILFVARRTVTPIIRRGERIPSAFDTYQRLLAGLNRGATKVAGVIQNGSLPIYLGVVVLTASVVPLWIAVRRVRWPGLPPWIGPAAQIPITVVLLGGALAAALVRRRFTAVMFLSTVGYAMTALFVVHGAPDLALTQAAVETVSTVLFVLVLRRLPDRFERHSTPFTFSVRVAVAAVVGVAVFVMAIVAGAARTAMPISAEMIERSLPDAYGRNVVNVILVDFRGIDTLGEVSVLAAAAIGTVAIARTGWRRRRLAAAAVSTQADSPA